MNKIIREKRCLSEMAAPLEQLLSTPFNEYPVFKDRGAPERTRYGFDYEFMVDDFDWFRNSVMRLRDTEHGAYLGYIYYSTFNRDPEMYDHLRLEHYVYFRPTALSFILAVSFWEESPSNGFGAQS